MQEELSNLFECYKENNEKLDENLEKVEFLSKELDLIREINNQTKDFLLLEMESNLDRQKQTQFEYEKKFNYFKEIIDLLKEENNEKIEVISNLNSEIDRLKQDLVEKNDNISILKSENLTFKNNIFERENKIDLLKKDIESLKQ